MPGRRRGELARDARRAGCLGDAALPALIFGVTLVLRTWEIDRRSWLLGDQIRDWEIALRPFADLPLVGPPTHVGGYTIGPAFYWILWTVRVTLGPWFDNLPHAGGIGQAAILSAADALLFVAVRPARGLDLDRAGGGNAARDGRVRPLPRGDGLEPRRRLGVGADRDGARAARLAPRRRRARCGDAGNRLGGRARLHRRRLRRGRCLSRRALRPVRARRSGDGRCAPSPRSSRCRRRPTGRSSIASSAVASIRDRRGRRRSGATGGSPTGGSSGCPAPCRPADRAGRGRTADRRSSDDDGHQAGGRQRDAGAAAGS
jgi:hypothetical protein